MGHSMSVDVRPKQCPLRPPSEVEETTCVRSTADRIVGLIYRWIFKVQLCALILRKLVKEQGSLSTGQKIWQDVLMIPYGLPGAREKDKKQGPKCDKIRDKIQHLYGKLRTESRCKNPKHVDRYVLFELMKSLVKSEGLNDPTSNGIVEKLRNDYLKSGNPGVMREAMSNLLSILRFFNINICVATTQAAPEDALVQMEKSLHPAIDKCQKAMMGNDKGTISKSLEDLSGILLAMSEQFSQNAYDAQISMAQTIRSQTGQSGGQSVAWGSGDPGRGGGGWGRRPHEEEEDEDSREDENSYEVEEDEDSREHKRSCEEERKRKKLRVALLNVRSVSKKAICEGHLIKNLILNNDLDLFLITETWLHPGPEGDGVLRRLLPSNRNFVHKPREHRRGGGVAIVYSDSVQFQSVTLPYLSTFECVAGSVRHHTWDRPVLIITIYHPTATRYEDFSNFKTQFTRLLDEQSKEYSSIVVAGDFNIWVDNERRRPGREFNELLRISNLEQFVPVPTHQAGHILDLVVGREMNITNVYVNNDGISDHFTVYFNAGPQERYDDDDDDRFFDQFGRLRF